MPNDEQRVNRCAKFLRTVAPLLAFVIPMLILYYLDPSSFEKTWKGRTYYLFFLWLVSLEMILGWEELQTSKLSKLSSIRTLAFGITLALPTIYLFTTNFYGLNSAIVDWFAHSGAGWADQMPLSMEYLIFSALFALIVFLEYGIKALKDFAISTFFLGTIGIIYTIDNLYPFGRFAPFQILVPTTATLASNFLNMIGYRTTMLITYSDPTYGSLTYLEVKNSQGGIAGFPIAWPCSGIESLLIYTVTILLFLKKSSIPLWQKTVYFVFGAAITYFINILRIATIFVISINTGGGYTPQVARFHDYYGQLYSITWIIAYPLIIIGTRALWGKIRRNKDHVAEDASESPANPSLVTS